MNYSNERPDSRSRRYTGCLPPPEVLAEFPNWVFALDEEDVEGQDETTIRPESQQLYISSETEFTAADATLASGAVQPAIITMEDNKPQAVDVWNGNDWWGIVNCGWSWRTMIEDRLPENERRPSVQMGDPKVFPMQVRSRLARADGSRWEFTIYPDGSVDHH